MKNFLLLLAFLAILAFSQGCGNTHRIKIERSNHEVNGKVDVVIDWNIPALEEEIYKSCEQEYETQEQIDACVQVRLESYLKAFEQFGDESETRDPSEGSKKKVKNAKTDFSKNGEGEEHEVQRMGKLGNLERRPMDRKRRKSLCNKRKLPRLSRAMRQACKHRRKRDSRRCTLWRSNARLWKRCSK